MWTVGLTGETAEQLFQPQCLVSLGDGTCLEFNLGTKRDSTVFDIPVGVSVFPCLILHV